MCLMEEITVKNLDHLGIVAGLIDEIGIVEPTFRTSNCITRGYRKLVYLIKYN